MATSTDWQKNTFYGTDAILPRFTHKQTLENTMSAHHLRGLLGSVLPSRTFGGQGRDRTGDTRIFSPLLYQLSYLATRWAEMVGAQGFEPWTQ